MVAQIKELRESFVFRERGVQVCDWTQQQYYRVRLVLSRKQKVPPEASSRVSMRVCFRDL